MMDAIYKQLDDDFGLNKGDVDYMFEWLDDLREEGSVNMFAASRVMYDEFEDEGATRKECDAVLVAWMTTFNQRHPQ